MTPPREHGAAAAHVADRVRAAIIRGSYPPGTRIRQEELADETGASRVPVREALRMLEAEGLVGWRLPLWTMNRHRFLVEADGNSSSWDRYMLIGSFGGVPIRFECEWEECWHGLLVDGVNCVTADRRSLPEVVDRLRSRPPEAVAIAKAASRTVADSLSRRHLQRQFRDALVAA